MDASAPTTSIAVRLLSGQRKVIQINESQTVRDLALHCIHAAGLSAARDVPWINQRFGLVAGGFPPQPLDNAQATLVQAGLTGRAQVTVKKVE